MQILNWPLLLRIIMYQLNEMARVKKKTFIYVTFEMQEEKKNIQNT